MTNITNKKAYYEVMAEIETLLAKGLDNLTEVEEVKLDELSDAVEAWENIEYPMPLQPDFKDILTHVMQSKGFNQSQLSDQLEVSDSLISGILKGKKSPNVDMLINIHKKFQIDGNLLLNSLHL
ncbi:antitoxin component HigA of HigAB toxin-antitoxin module [Chitinophaga terrae (ex Kim and Jung 2007)]|uniref:helix-turn-helix domain-containing protein n=1 Tax=Chitinophaga terrae (ex Kim and Jung 2007) TaxID=408074 RepID=UPI002782AC8C|nr:helix-turn-helix domain-containing protein [Chitinophaga terrae (ex Kim and Jung 2007)]MDQ0107520.1 antitoxin component HigA of HigAB toxin-antitoxin module [Chitinophaga terrae (ex Kim and Jung 2007)]